jgi:hypothetical protein
MSKTLLTSALTVSDWLLFHGPLFAQILPPKPHRAPEIDPTAAVIGLGVVIGAALLIVERLKRR